MMKGNGDKRGNITAAFGSDVILEGMTGVPNLLLKYYSKIGITDSEMMLVVQLMHLQTSYNQNFPSDDFLAQIMSGDKPRIKADLASLIEKGIISINHIFCEVSNDIVPIYSYEPLFEKISELWACEKVRVYQQMKKTLKEQKQKAGGASNKERQPAFSLVCQSFEKEFARLLSPVEIEKIGAWLDDNEGRPELVLEALKRAVLLSKHNFKYIDSILLEWQKNNLKTVTEVSAHEVNYRERQVVRNPRRKTETPILKKDKFRLLYHG